MRQMLLAGVATVNDRGLTDQEARGAEGRQKMERKRMRAADKVDAVKALQARGFKIFPITAGAKAPPLIKDWPRLATDDEALTGLWEDQPDANIGIHCEGLLVIDVDTKNDGHDSLAGLEMQYDLPTTLTARTPTGGRHIIYRLPEGHPGVPNSAGTLGRGLDVRSTRGYIVAVGSKVEAGEYKWEDPSADIEEAPEWLVERLSTSRVPVEKVDRNVRVPPANHEVYERAQAWLWTTAPDAGGYLLACGLRDRGLNEDQVVTLLMSGEAPAGSWPYEEARLRAKNAFRYAQNAPGASVALPSDFKAMAPEAVAALPVPVAAPPQRPRGAPQKMLAFAAGGAANAGYVIKGLLQRSSYALVYGAPGSGKTFTVLDMAWHVAAGEEWMGKRVKQGAVLYLPFEGAGGMRGRAAALRQHYGDWDVPLYFDDSGYNLREPAGRQALGEAIAQLPSKPTMIVIDTLAHALCGGDENSAQDVSAFNAGVQALIAHTGACVVVIHHPGKNVANGARGSSALLGAVDTEMCVADRKVTPTKQRDVELGDPIGFQLKTISVGFDADGDIVTSCVVVPNVVAKSPEAEKLKQGSVQHLAYETLKELRPNNDPVTDAEWKAACAEFLPPRNAAWADTRMRLKRARLVVQNDAGLWMRRME